MFCQSRHCFKSYYEMIKSLLLSDPCIALQQVARRTIYSSARRQVDNKVPLKQKAFQEDNGMPVHLKGGSVDALLYRTTMALTILGAGYVVYELVKAAYPQKKD
uniref:Cytochrome c oxidase subunit 7A2, mitochondrial n=1 Tax=Amphiprion ocellaris TaxID=80972 RepID=A0AAQ6A160_AMPOC